MRYLACTFSQMKSNNMFPCFCHREFPDISLGDLLCFQHRTSEFSCLCMSMLTPNSNGNMQNHGYLGCFHAASRESISGVWGIARLLHTFLHPKGCFHDISSSWKWQQKAHSTDSGYASSQWETALLCNTVSHWLVANLESALSIYWLARKRTTDRETTKSGSSLPNFRAIWTS